MKDLMIQDLQKLLQIESVSQEDDSDKPFGEKVNQALKCALDMCSEYGLKVKNCNNYSGWAQAGSGDDLMGILVHLDIVPIGEGWTKDPLGNDIADGKIYGRGTVDDKGPAVACIHALKELIDENANFNKRVRIIFGLSEETGDWEDMDYYKEHEEIPSFGFTPDADFPVIYGEKGIMHVTLTMPLDESGIIEITGGDAVNMVPDRCCATVNKDDEKYTIEKTGIAAHGSMPEEGENAISKTMEEISKVTESKFADFYNETIGFTSKGENINLGISDDESGSLTLNAGTIHSNADKIELALDIRYPVTFDGKEVESRLKEKCKDYGVSCEVNTCIPPVYMDKDGEVVKVLMDVYKSITGDDSKAAVMGGGTYARAMDNIIAFGPVFPGRPFMEHKNDEYISIEDFHSIKEIYKIAIERLAVNSDK